MSLLTPPPYIRDGKAWYFLAIYYSRTNWAELANHIMQFYTKRQTQFCNCLISFSDERGEHIQVTLISPNCENNYQTEIENYFQQYLAENQSISAETIDYGRVLWCNYPNNSLVWNTFKLIHYTEQLIRFHEKTQKLALQLLDDDFSQDNIFTLGLYLATKGLMCFDPDMQNNIVPETLTRIMSSFQDYGSVELALQEVLDQIDVQQMCEAIASYIEENPSEYSIELTEWLAEVENMKETGFQYFHTTTCSIIGLSGMYSIFILTLLDIWQKTLPATSN
ncbi:MAG: hypothetical protein FWC39_03545 [Bacteroidetes bacterium]|nr:hypothetical protein [Bacteroidota bacterium]